MALSTNAFGSIVLFQLFLYIVIFTAVSWWRKRDRTTGGGSIGPCGRPTGMLVENRTGSELERFENCDKACGSRVPNAFRPVSVTEDVFIDGERPPRPGLYCVRSTASVVSCNTATSKLVRGVHGKWSCHPLWPSIFGGSDGSDILVCGGKLTVDGAKYEYRLPPSSRMPPVRDPYAEVDRFACTPGEYVGGPRDYMNNEYLPLGANRFRRIRNNCAKFVANAAGVVAPPMGADGRYCNCLPSHGRLRRETSAGGNNHVARAAVENVQPETGVRGESPGVFPVPYACSPCVASGDLRSTDGIFNFPVRCTKSNQMYFENLDWIDKQPCGEKNFTSASAPSCVNTWVYVGDRDVSYAFKKATNGL